MVAKLLTATSKLFILLAVACGVLGLLSLDRAKADSLPAIDPDNPCNCGTPQTSTGPDWDAFVTCYTSSCSTCVETCGPPIAPGAPGYDSWYECYRSQCLFNPLNPIPPIPGCAIACTPPVPCTIVVPNPGAPPIITCTEKRCTGVLGCWTWCKCLKIPAIGVCSCL